MGKTLPSKISLYPRSVITMPSKLKPMAIACKSLLAAGNILGDLNCLQSCNPKSI